MARIRPEIAVGVVFVAGMFLNIMDSTIVNVALPAMARDFAVAPTEVEWVVLGYLLSLAVWIPASGWIGDRFGTRRIYLLALAVFVGASALCGLARSLGALVAFRILQGGGGGMLTPVGTAMLFRVFPPERRAQASRILVIPTVTAPALGPILGGWLVDHMSWRWCFYVNLPVGALAFLWGWLFVEEHKEPAEGSFDWAGFALSAAGLGAALFALSEGPSRGWTSLPVLASGLPGLAALAALVVVELRREHPMLRLDLLGERLFRSTNGVTVLAYAAFLGTLFAMPMFLQTVSGFTAFESGLTTFPEALGVVAASQLAGRIYGRVGPRRLMCGGLLIAASMIATLRLITPDTDVWWIRTIMFAIGAGMGNVFIALQTATFAQMESSEMGHASAIFNATRQVGGSIGVAVLSTVIAVVAGHHALTEGQAGGATLTAFHDAFTGGAALALCAAATALTVQDADAAATMAPRSRSAGRLQGAT
jgi:EmrB/QacA subfamily drug resistance transporter